MATIDRNIVKSIADQKVVLNKKYHVEFLAIFGSVSKGTSGPDSDIDILVRYREVPGIFAFLDLKKYLEDIVKRPVDLVTEGALKKQLRDVIMKEAVRVV